MCREIDHATPTNEVKLTVEGSEFQTFIMRLAKNVLWWNNYC